MTIVRTRSLSLLVALATLLGSGAVARADWPSFGGKTDDQVEPASAEAPSDEGTMIDSPAFKIGWPKVEMPKFTWKPGFLGGGENPAAGGGENPVSQTLDKVASASKRAADGVRGAWGNAVSKLSLGGGDSAAQGGGGEKTGWLARMFGPTEQEPQGAQTVQEFLAQDRPGTTRR